MGCRYTVHVVIDMNMFMCLYDYVGIIAMGWVLYVESCKIRQQLKKSRDLNVRNYRTRLLELKGIWETMKTSHRVIIHLPSRGRHISTCTYLNT